MLLELRVAQDVRVALAQDLARRGQQASGAAGGVADDAAGLRRGRQIAARDQATRTRGAGSSAPTAECLVADPDLCVEDR